MKYTYLLLSLFCISFYSIQAADKLTKKELKSQQQKECDIREKRHTVEGFFQNAKKLIKNSGKAFRPYTDEEIEFVKKKRQNPEILFADYGTPQWLDFGATFGDNNNESLVVRFHKNGHLEMQYVYPSADRMLPEDTQIIPISHGVTVTQGHSPIDKVNNKSKQEMKITCCVSKNPLFDTTLKPEIMSEEYPEEVRSQAHFYVIDTKLSYQLQQWLGIVERYVLAKLVPQEKSEHKQ